MGRFRRGSTRLTRRSVGNKPLWISEGAAMSPAAGALSALNIYQADVDAALNTVIEANPTVFRILGRGSIIATVAGTATVTCAIFRTQNVVGAAFGGSLDPNTVQNLTDEDCLWFGHYGVALAAAVGFSWVHVDIDVKTRRKLETNEKLEFVVSNAAGGVAITSTWRFRVLSKLNV